MMYDVAGICISTRIEEIQGSTTEAIGAIGDMTNKVTEVNNINSVIAASVEEQSAVTNEISRFVNEAARGGKSCFWIRPMNSMS